MSCAIFQDSLERFIECCLGCDDIRSYDLIMNEINDGWVEWKLVSTFDFLFYVFVQCVYVFYCRLIVALLRRVIVILGTLAIVYDAKGGIEPSGDKRLNPFLVCSMLEQQFLCTRRTTFSAMPEFTGRTMTEQLVDAVVFILQQISILNTWFWCYIKYYRGLGWSLNWCAKFFLDY